jgi:hypothetical protein
MSHHHSCYRQDGKPVWIQYGLEILLLVLIGLMFLLLAYQAFTYPGRSSAVKFGRTLASGEQTKLLPNLR